MSITRILFVQARAYAVVTCAIDVAFLAIIGSIFSVAVDILVIAFFSLLTFRMMFLRVSHVAESAFRKIHAGITCPFLYATLCKL